MQPAFAATVPEGLWRLGGDKAEVRISNCGGALCATLAGLRKPLGKDGRPKRDGRNPDPALRDRPLIGVGIARQMAFVD